MSSSQLPYNQKQRTLGCSEPERGATLVEYVLLVALVLLMARPGLSAMADVAKPFCQAEVALINYTFLQQGLIGWFIHPVTGKGYCKRTYVPLPGA